MQPEQEITKPIQAPFPWFGGKSRVAPLVWSRFGNVKNYVEPFFGSGAVLLGRPHAPQIETINDLDGFVANFWRSVKLSPKETAKYADNPVNENDLHARHSWLVSKRAELSARLNGDPDFHDAKIAGYWVWGLCCWIGSGFCSGKGPWVVNDGGMLVNGKHLSNAGQGVNRQLPHLSNAGQGVNRQLPHLGNAGRGAAIDEWFSVLSGRLANTRVTSGDWSRSCSAAVTYRHGETGVFLDPPYEDTGSLYAEDSQGLSSLVRAWAIENGSNPRMRIALCGYDGEHGMPDSWTCVQWKSRGGYGITDKAVKNRSRERIWFSPHCLVQYPVDLGGGS